MLATMTGLLLSCAHAPLTLALPYLFIVNMQDSGRTPLEEAPDSTADSHMPAKDQVLRHACENMSAAAALSCCNWRLLLAVQLSSLMASHGRLSETVLVGMYTLRYPLTRSASPPSVENLLQKLAVTIANILKANGNFVGNCCRRVYIVQPL